MRDAEFEPRTDVLAVWCAQTFFLAPDLMALEVTNFFSLSINNLNT